MVAVFVDLNEIQLEIVQAFGLRYGTGFILSSHDERIDVWSAKEGLLFDFLAFVTLIFQRRLLLTTILFSNSRPIFLQKLKRKIQGCLLEIRILDDTKKRLDRRNTRFTSIEQMLMNVRDILGKDATSNIASRDIVRAFYAGFSEFQLALDPEGTETKEELESEDQQECGKTADQNDQLASPENFSLLQQTDIPDEKLSDTLDGKTKSLYSTVNCGNFQNHETTLLGQEEAHIDDKSYHAEYGANFPLSNVNDSYQSQFSSRDSTFQQLDASQTALEQDSREYGVGQLVEESQTIQRQDVPVYTIGTSGLQSKLSSHSSLRSTFDENLYHDVYATPKYATIGTASAHSNHIELSRSELAIQDKLVLGNYRFYLL